MKLKDVFESVGIIIFLNVVCILFIVCAGVPRLSTPPPLASTSLTSNQDKVITAPRPIRVSPNLVTRLEDLSQPWTRSPTKSKMEPVVATWHFISSDTSSAESSAISMFL